MGTSKNFDGVLNDSTQFSGMLPERDIQKRVFAAYPTGVCVVTTDSELGPVGVTVGTVSSLSLEPPLVSWALKKNSKRFKAFRDCQEICIHILASHQAGMARDFSDAGLEPFSGYSYQLSDFKTPLIENCPNRLVCRAWASHDGGDHQLFVFRIIDVHLFELQPLIYLNRQFMTPLPASNGYYGGQ